MQKDLQECLVMAKPAGPRCNLCCSYCYYLEKKAMFASGPQQMSEEIARAYIRQRLAASPGPITHFEWHGGEPTLLGLDFFLRIRNIQEEYRPPGRRITNGLQTNGLLLDDDWARFLAGEGFSVGLSLDGPADLHNPFRTTADGQPTQSRVVKAFHLLKRHRVFCNILCVLQAANAPEPDRVYNFFRDLGVTHLQFLPMVAGQTDARPSPAAEPEVIGDFLCRIFDRWLEDDVGRIVIQNIDEALRPVYGVPHALCIHRKTCGNVVVLEHDGSLYACDHFVHPDYRIGNIQERSLTDLGSDPKLVRFGKDKLDSLPQACRDCEVLDACNGGCPKDRIDETADGEQGTNRLCKAYKAFFSHSRPELTRLATHMHAGNPLRTFSPLSISDKR